MTDTCEVLTVIHWVRGSELPGVGFAWENGAGDLYDFSSGWTFELKVGEEEEAAILTSAGGFIGTDGTTEPNLLWLPPAGELDDLPNAVHLAQVTALRVSDGLDDTRKFYLAISGRIL